MARSAAGGEHQDLLLCRLGDEQALDDIAAHYQALVSVLGEGIVVHDLEGRLRVVNAAAERLFGHPQATDADGHAAAAGGMPLWPDGRPMAFEDTPTGIVLAGGPAQAHVSLLWASASGERRWLDVSAQPVIRPGAGTLLAVVTSFTDVTQHQRLQEELRHHREHLEELVAQRTRDLQTSSEALATQQKLARAVADAVPGMIAYWDAELRCRFSNKAYLEWFGRTDEEMQGMRIQDLLGEDLFALNRPYIDGVLQGRPQHFQRSLRRPDGSTGHTLASYIPDRVDGRVRGFNVVVSDVTELKQAELRLERLNEQLQRRALQADEATRAKSAFLATMSHEIRTPMNAIVGLSHLMQREAQDAVQRTRLGKIHEASQHLLQVINDILDLSKIEAGKMSLDPSDFVTDELLMRALGMVNAQAREKALELVLECGALPRRLHGDAVRLSQCLINLLSNAVKFTDAGWIRLRCEMQADKGRRVQLRFEVEDTGPGIEPRLQASLFNAFEQADNSATRRHGGTGLGLALTRHFARLMGGDAGLVSQPGRGSIFWFTAWLDAVAADDEAPPDAGLRGLRALLIDALPQSLRALKRGLDGLGLEVEAQPWPALSPEVPAGAPPDVLLIGHPLPPAAAIAPWPQWLARLSGGRAACILLASVVDADLERRASEAGFDLVLAKPVTRSALRDALLRGLRRGPSPVPLPSPPGSDTEARLRQDHAGQCVLLVEDNPINQEVAAELLTLVGLQVQTASDGAHALEMMRARRFDLVLMDVQMPTMDGLSATREIRRLDGPRTPILAMTANAFGDDRLACLQAGMDDHVPKPVDPQQLYASLLRWLPARPVQAGLASASAGPGPSAQAGPALLERLQGVQGLDVQRAMHVVGGHAGALRRVLQRFCATYAQGQDTLAWAGELPTLERLGAASHSLLGACGAIGASALQAALESFESERRAQPDPAVHRARSQAINEQLLGLVRQLQQALDG